MKPYFSYNFSKEMTGPHHSNAGVQPDHAPFHAPLAEGWRMTIRSH